MSTGPLYAMGGAHPHALAKNDAMRGLATGNREGKPAEREQDIHTPDVILDVCAALWGSIEFDPCASRTCEPFASRNLYIEDDGLSVAWEPGAFWNPPYKDLAAWLAHAAAQEERIGLYPVRTNRQWWCDFHSRHVDRIAWLKPLKFAGFKQAFPAPLVLTYQGIDPEGFEEVVARAKIACLVSLKLE